MSSFFTYNTDVSEHEEKLGAVITTAWSNGDHATLAVSSKNGVISFFQEEGDRMVDPIEGNNIEIKRAGECNMLAWHPRNGMLAMGWNDGTVQLWSEKDNVVKGDSQVHQAPITAMVWSPECSRLITGDQNGVLAVWQGQAGHKSLLLVCRYKRKGAITNIVFRGPSQMMFNEGASNKRGCPPFFFGGSAGVVDFADDLSTCSEVFNVGAPLNSMFYSHSGDYIIVVTVDVVLFKYDIRQNNKIALDKKVKLSIKGNGSDMQCVWAGGGLLAAATKEKMVRMWHLSQDVNYFLYLPNDIGKDSVTTLSFNPRQCLLAAGTAGGKVAMWKFIGEFGASEPSETDWEALPPVEPAGLAGGIASLVWGQGPGLLSVGVRNNVGILNQTVLHCKTVDSNSAIQMSSDTIFLQSNNGRHKKVQTQVRIKGLDITEDYAVMWNGKAAEVRNMTDNMFNMFAQFDTKAKCIVIRDQTLYLATGHKLELASIKGIVKKVITFTESEGSPTHLDVNKDYLACSTNAGILKLWDISRLEPKQVVPGRSFREECPGLITSIRVNNNGTKISILCSKLDGGGSYQPDTKMYVYDVELDKLFSHEFGPDFYPVGHCWDPNEPRLVAVESKKAEMSAKKQHEAKQRDMSEYESEHTKTVKRVDAEVTTLFATSEYGVLMQDSFAIAAVGSSLMGIDVPYIYFMSRPAENEDGSDDDNSNGPLPSVKKRTMRDFVGLEKVNDETKEDLINFSYHLTVGNMDEAYRAVKKISSETIWENMAQMCVKTKRLDVAEVCLGNMNNARGARAVREAKKEPEKDAQVAMVAIQLGLIDDAEKLYEGCNRYDLLCKLYMASGRWHDALLTCAKHDRINLKTTHYQYAKYLESISETAEAIKHYEKAQTHKTEVPRMLFDSQHMSDLEQYIMQSNDPALIKWWAQYCESNEATDDAIKYYEAAKETLSLVRVYCFRGMDEKAAEICIETQDKAACYHLARHYESQDEIEKAIKFYTRAKKYNHGIRLAKEHRLDGELMTLALESDKGLKVDVARYFEKREAYDKAVLLYQKGGKTQRALELCFHAQLFESLRSISDSLNTDTDPALLAKCGEFFLEHQQYDKAVHLFITGKKIRQGTGVVHATQLQHLGQDGGVDDPPPLHGQGPAHRHPRQARGVL